MYSNFLHHSYSLIIILLSEFVIINGISIKYLVGICYYYNNLSSTFFFFFFCIIIKRKYKPMCNFYPHQMRTIHLEEQIHYLQNL